VATRKVLDVNITDVELTPPNVATAVQVPAVGKFDPENVISVPL
jgi:hypothetical protein